MNLSTKIQRYTSNLLRRTCSMGTVVYTLTPPSLSCSRLRHKILPKFMKTSLELIKPVQEHEETTWENCCHIPSPRACRRRKRAAGRSPAAGSGRGKVQFPPPSAAPCKPFDHTDFNMSNSLTGWLKGRLFPNTPSSPHLIDTCLLYCSNLDRSTSGSCSPSALAGVSGGVSRTHIRSSYALLQASSVGTKRGTPTGVPHMGFGVVSNSSTSQYQNSSLCQEFPSFCFPHQVPADGGRHFTGDPSGVCVNRI